MNLKCVIKRIEPFNTSTNKNDECESKSQTLCTKDEWQRDFSVRKRQ